MAKTRGTAGRNNRPSGTRAPGDYHDWIATGSYGSQEYAKSGGFLFSPTGQLIDVTKVVGVVQSGYDIEAYHGEAMQKLGPQEGWHNSSYGGAADAGWVTARLWGNMGPPGNRFVSIRVPGSKEDPTSFRQAKRVLQAMLDVGAADWGGRVDLTFEYGKSWGGANGSGVVSEMLDARSFSQWTGGV